MNILTFCLLAAAGAALFLWWRSKRNVSRETRNSKAARLYLLLYDGSSYVLHDAVRSNGCFVVNGIEYPSSACRPMELATDMLLNMYIFAAEPIALTTHQQLMKHRAAIVKGYLFKSGGDMTQMVNFIAAGAVVACALFVYMSVGSISSASVQQQVILERIDKWTQSPLVIKK